MQARGGGGNTSARPTEVTIAEVRLLLVGKGAACGAVVITPNFFGAIRMCLVPSYLARS